MENYQSQVKMAKNHILFDGLVGIMIMRLYNELWLCIHGKTYLCYLQMEDKILKIINNMDHGMAQRINISTYYIR